MKAIIIPALATLPLIAISFKLTGTLAFETETLAESEDLAFLVLADLLKGPNLRETRLVGKTFHSETPYSRPLRGRWLGSLQSDPARY